MTWEVTVSYTGWDWDDTYTMKSPTGKRLTIKPNGHWSHSTCIDNRKLTETEEELLERIKGLCEDNSRWSEEQKMLATKQDMELFKSASEKTQPKRRRVR